VSALAAALLVLLSAAALAGARRAAARAGTVARLGAPPVARRAATAWFTARFESWRGRHSSPAVLALALEAVARAVRAGSSLRVALAEAGDAVGGAVGAELRGVAGVAARGVPLADALDRWARDRGDGAVALAAGALALAAEAGGTQARAVDGVAATLRERAAVDAEIRALSSQARLSAMVVAIAPVAFGALEAATDPRAAGFLLRPGLGWACLAGGLGLDALAAWWMAQLTRSWP
jgi:Flp pilus assembly protein TadB